MDSARDKACPAGSPTPYDYPAPIPASYNAPCVGTADFNGFYGDGIVNALDGRQLTPVGAAPRPLREPRDAVRSPERAASRRGSGRGQSEVSAQPSQAAPIPRASDRVTLATACG